MLVVGNFSLRTVCISPCFVLGNANICVERESLIGFACGHIYHLSCLLDAITDPDTIAAADRLKKQLRTDEALEDAGFTRSVGAKVAHAHVLRSIVGEGCKVCMHDDGEEDTPDTLKR